jgi:DNA-binding transcriptional LysR family regulator
MGQLEDLRAFVQIVENESIGKAAEQSGVAKSALSRRLRLLEERLQTALIVRTTRQWSLTEAGRQYYERGLRVLAMYDEFDADMREGELTLSGEIRLSVPLYFGQLALTEPLLAFAAQHPDVQLDVDYNDRIVDMLAEQLDLVVRITTLQDSSLIARRLCESRHCFCVSPEYLKNNHPLTEPEDLRQHRILQYGHTKRPKWKFASGKDGARKAAASVSLQANMNSLDGSFLIAAAEHGHGVCRVPDFLAKPSLESGALVEVLADYKLESEGVYIVYPASRHLPKRTRLLMDFLIAHFGQCG